MKRTAKPEQLIQYEKFINNPPRCCHNCQYYDENGFCELAKQKPPEEFTQKINSCEEWLQEVPF